jgi:acid phosphatase
MGILLLLTGAYRRSIVIAASSTVSELRHASYLSSQSTKEDQTGGDSSPQRFRVVQVQIVHRHGDRSPITPLKNETFWASELVKPELLEKVASTTKILRNQEETVHHAAGRGPFGKLTQLGLLQMVQVGTTLRERLHTDLNDDHNVDEHGNVHHNRGRLFDPCYPLDTSKVKVFSTDFPRTIQSAQGTLVGLFPDSLKQVEIDARHTDILIPDPQPRRSREQETLERQLASRSHLVEREQQMRELAIRTTSALRPLLSEDAFQVSFGVGEEKGSDATTEPLLSWGQMSEITKCLSVRDMLPPAITSEMQQEISKYTAWKWFESLRHPRLAYLAMNGLVARMVESMERRLRNLNSNDDMEEEAPLHIYSAHDSTLIGLLCAFHLEQPAQWPEYASFLSVELLEAKPLLSGDDHQTKYMVRFSLNGEILRSKWGGETLDMIPFDQLSHNLATSGADIVHSN